MGPGHGGGEQGADPGLAVCGPAARVRERLAAHREAGVGTLIAAPTAWTHAERVTQLRRLAELAA